jgi:diacylglycerol kinase family enzyme
VLILVNPRAGAQPVGPWIRQLNEVLTSRGFRTETRHDLAQVAQRANRWHEAGELRALVAAGGDGTAAELVNRESAPAKSPRLPC